MKFKDGQDLLQIAHYSACFLKASLCFSFASFASFAVKL